MDFCAGSKYRSPIRYANQRHSKLRIFCRCLFAATYPAHLAFTVVADVARQNTENSGAARLVQDDQRRPQVGDINRKPLTSCDAAHARGIFAVDIHFRPFLPQFTELALKLHLLSDGFTASALPFPRIVFPALVDQGEGDNDVADTTRSHIIKQEFTASKPTHAPFAAIRWGEFWLSWMLALSRPPWTSLRGCRAGEGRSTVRSA